MNRTDSQQEDIKIKYLLSVENLRLVKWASLSVDVVNHLISRLTRISNYIIMLQDYYEYVHNTYLAT